MSQQIRGFGGHICFLFGLQIENSSSQKYFYDNFYKILLSSFKEKVLSDPTEMYFFVFAIFQLAFENNCKFAVCFDLVWILEINCWLLNFIIIG